MNESIKKRIEAVRRGEIPAGYRQTKLGIAPVEWMDCTLDDILTQRKTLMCVSADAPLLSFTIEEGVIDPKDKKSNKRDFLIKDMATKKFALTEVGDIIYNPANLKFGAIHRNDLKRGVVSPIYGIFYGAPNSIFMGYFLHDQRFIDYAKTYTEGSVEKLKTLSADAFLKLKVTIPSLLEQAKIAEILATCDRVIELKQQLLEEKRHQKQWLMQKLLDPTSGVQPQGCSGKWKQSRLQELGIFSKGSGISNEDCSSGSCPCIKYGDIYVSYDEFFVDAISHTEDEIFDKAPIVHKGSLLFTGSGEDPKEIGKCTAYLGDEPIAVGGDIIVMKPKEAVVNPLFLSYALNSYSAIKQKASLGQGYSVVHIYGEDIKKISVDIPIEVETQERIAEIIMSSNREIHLIENEIASWQQKKKALMQLLLTGLVRVNA